MGFRTEWDDPDFVLSDRSARGVAVSWYKLLRGGHAAIEITSAAERLLSEMPERQVPSLGGFLARYETRYAESAATVAYSGEPHKNAGAEFGTGAGAHRAKTNHIKGVTAPIIMEHAR